MDFRESPRRRHDLPRLVVLLLWPFFHYSDWRGAWILRIVGERYGPVLRVTPGRDHDARARRRSAVQLRWPAALTGRTALLAAAGIAVAAALGFLVAGSTSGGNSAPALGKPTSAGMLEVSLPNGWQRRPAQTLPQLGLVGVVGASSRGRWIEVGTATTSDPSLLPATILASLSGPPAARLVTLNRTTFYRYPQVSIRGLSGSQSIYAVPTPTDTVLAVLDSPAPDASLAGTFQRVVASMRLRSGSLAPGMLPAYASTLAAAIGRLNRARASWASRLSAARTARRQASAASRLAAAHTLAAATLAGLDPGPARSANIALITALRGAASAYGALARAAARGRIRDYHLDAALVADANNTLNSALTALTEFGYRVS